MTASTRHARLLDRVCQRVPALEGRAAAWLVRSAAGKKDTFREFRTLRVIAEPTDLELYRSLLPADLESVKKPLVSISVTHAIDVGPWPLAPYQLSNVSLRGAWQGEEGWHPITMPENSWMPV